MSPRPPPPTHTSPGAVTKTPGDKDRVTERELLCQNGELKGLIEGCEEETKFAGVGATLCVAARRRWIYSGAGDAAKSRTNTI